MANYRIIIVDDHPLFRDALRQALTGCFSGSMISEAGSLDELSQILGANSDTDLILLDLKMPGVKGSAGMIYLRAQYPEIPVVVVSSTEDPGTINRCIELGASGFIPKSQPVDALRNAVKDVFAGGVWTPPDLDLTGVGDDETVDLISRLATLTPQQVRVLMMLGEGLRIKQIAYQLGVSEATVKAHVSAILQKLGVDSRTQAVIAMGKIEGSEWQKEAG